MGKYWTPKTDDVDDITADIFNEAFPKIEADMENKVGKEEGKGLSTNDFTDEYKEKVETTEILATENQDRIIALEAWVGDMESNIYALQDDNNLQTERIETLETNIGDIETALDNIIAIQNRFMGGDA